MKRSLLFLAFALTFLTVPASLSAQALPTATRGGFLQVGAEYSNQNTDYLQKRIAGISGYASFDFTAHLGVEVNVRSLTIDTPQDYSQSAYEGGLRYVYPIHRFRPFARVSAGIGGYNSNRPYIHLPGTVSSGTYGMYSFGGGLDIVFSHHINVRAIDFEQQEWPGWAPNGLTPTVISFGAAYRFR